MIINRKSGDRKVHKNLQYSLVDSSGAYSTCTNNSDTSNGYDYRHDERYSSIKRRNIEGEKLAFSILSAIGM